MTEKAVDQAVAAHDNAAFQADAAALNAIALTSLRHSYDSGKHGTYVDLLVQAVKHGHQNVALSGTFGTGKSSVLEGLATDRRVRRKKPLLVSLATLPGSATGAQAGTSGTVASETLQREIVKQFLYAFSPSALPRSRFTRIRGPKYGFGAGIGALTSTILLALAYTVGQSGPAVAFARSRELAASWVWWCVDAVLIAAIAFFVYLLVSSLRVTSLSIGPARLGLDAKSGDVFDEFVEEIVYFFRRTKTRLVVFEDLDRFENGDIFQSLGDLCSLVNKPSRLKKKRKKTKETITFVYAIRDSIFSGAIPESGSSELTAVAAGNVRAARARAAADSPASDRAKFFDVIIPLVPFISREVAPDLLVRAIEVIPERWRPKRDLVGLVGPYFPDKRVIDSIRNEYVVFLRQLLVPSSVDGLDHNELFAMICYKHLDLADFEAIRAGDSKIDTAIRGVDDRTATALHDLDKRIAEKQNEVAAPSADARREAASRRLASQVRVVGYALGATPQAVSVSTEPEVQFGLDQLDAESLWAGLAEPDVLLSIHVRRGVMSDFSGAELTDLLGEDHDVAGWLDDGRSVLRSELEALQARRAWLRGATLQERLSAPSSDPRDPQHVLDLWPTAAGGTSNPAEGFLRELVAGGHIGHNYALYAVTYYGEFLTARARTFILRNVDHKVSAPLYSLDAADVEALVARAGEAFLATPAGLNVTIVNYFVESGRTDRAIDIVLRASSSDAHDFVELYLTNGSETRALIKALAPRWDGILDLIATTDQIPDTRRSDLISIALSNLSTSVTYVISETARDRIHSELVHGETLRRKVTKDAASALASLVDELGVRVANLRDVKDACLRDSLVALGALMIVRDNLDLATGDPDRVGLDTLRGCSKALFDSAVSAFPAYFDALSIDGRTGYAVDTSDGLRKVLRALGDDAADILVHIFQRARPGVALDDVTGVSPAILREVAAHRRLAVKAGNLDALVEAGAADELLAGVLEDAPGITADSDQAVHEALARLVVSNAHLTPDAKRRLVASLDLTEPIDPTDVLVDDPDLLEWLLANDTIDPDPATLFAGSGVSFSAALGSPIALASLEGQVPSVTLSPTQLIDIMSAADTPPGLYDEAEVALTPLIPTMGKALASRVVTNAIERRRLLESTLILLAGNGAEPAAVIEYLTVYESDCTDDTVVQTLAALKHPYRALVTSGGSIKLPRSRGLTSLLKRLESLNYVSSSRRSGFSEMKVNKRQARP